MTAMTQPERSAKTAAKRARLGEVELRHRVRLGIRAMLTDLMAWHGIEEQAEAIQLLALNADSVQLLPPAAGVEMLQHRARPGLIAKLEALADGDPQSVGLVVELLIAAAHAAGPEGSSPMLAIPRHEIRISENVAHEIYMAGAAEASRLDRAES